MTAMVVAKQHLKHVYRCRHTKQEGIKPIIVNVCIQKREELESLCGYKKIDFNSINFLLNKKILFNITNNYLGQHYFKFYLHKIRKKYFLFLFTNSHNSHGLELELIEHFGDAICEFSNKIAVL